MIGSVPGPRKIGDVSLTNRLTWVTVPEGNDRKIIYEHTSVPLNDEDMAPVFEPPAVQ